MGARSSFVETEGARLYVEEAGDGQADESAGERLAPPAFERLGEIAVPTLVLPADHDPPEMDPMCTAIAAAIPDARLVRIPDTDHVINLRRPEEFNHVVLGFLGEVL
jgi:3-oxoadipate enol-lactonase